MKGSKLRKKRNSRLKIKRMKKKTTWWNLKKMLQNKRKSHKKSKKGHFKNQRKLFKSQIKKERSNRQDQRHRNLRNLRRGQRDWHINDYMMMGENNKMIS